MFMFYNYYLTSDFSLKVRQAEENGDVFENADKICQVMTNDHIYRMVKERYSNI